MSLLAARHYFPLMHEHVLTADAGSALPPGPNLPTWIQRLEWMFRPTQFMDACARRYGDAFTITFIDGLSTVVVSHPDMVRDVFTGDPATFHAGESNVLLRPLVGENSVLLLDDQRHRAQRRLLMPPFHGERMEKYATAMREVATAEAATWPAGRHFPIHPAFQRISLNVILRAVFGLDETRCVGELRSALLRMMVLMGKPWLMFLMRPDGELHFSWLGAVLGELSPVTHFERARADVDRLLYEEFDRRRATRAAGEDILSLLLSAKHEDGSPMSDQELRDEMMTLLIAGHETSATALTWVLSEVLRRGEVLARIRSEVEAVTGGSPIEAKHVGKLEYVDAVIKETMRLHPIVPIVGRLLKAPARVGPLELPAGTVVAPSIYLAQRREDVWGDPEAFRPERFIEGRPTPFEWFPFGGGTRRCIGMAFAMFEMKVVLAELLSTFDLALRPGYHPRLKRRGITFAVSEGLPVSARPRG